MDSVYGGLLKDNIYISTDADPKKTDPYVKMDLIPSRMLGKNIMTRDVPQGRVPEVYFEGKFLTLASPEQANKKDIGVYADPYRADRRAAMEAKKKNIVEKDFIYSSFPRTGEGKGSFFGCFQEKPFAYVAEGDIPPPKKKKKGGAASSTTDQSGKVTTMQPNIKTNPGKKGTYGFPGLLLSKPVFDENAKRDEYDALRMKERENWEASKKKALGGPFKLAGVGRKFYDEKPNTGVSSVYDSYTSPPEKKKRHGKKVKPWEPTFKPDKPFVTSSGKCSGDAGNLSCFPNTWADPAVLEEEERKRNRRRGKKKEAPAPKPIGGVWRPSSFPKSSIITSLLRRFY